MIGTRVMVFRVAELRAQVKEARAHPGCGGGGVRHGEAAAAAAAAREEAAERGSHLRSRALSLLPMEDRTAHTVTGEESRSPKRDRLDHRVPSDQKERIGFSFIFAASCTRRQRDFKKRTTIKTEQESFP